MNKAADPRPELKIAGALPLSPAPEKVPVEIREHYLDTGFRVGMKPAGGIRTAKEALHWLVLVAETLGSDWLVPERFRFGASSLVNDLLHQIARRDDGHYQSPRRFSVD